MGVTLGFVAGLIVGWNFLKQPQWVADIIEKIKAKFRKDTPTE